MVKIITIIFMCFSNISISQEIKGTILDLNSIPINDCYILLINQENNETIDYTIPNEKGEYKVLLNNLNLKKIIVKCQGMGYVPQEKTLNIKPNNPYYNINFTLENKIITLNEIIVISEKVAIRVKNDTTSYDVSKFKRFEDRKIINVLKKMPGIQVDEKTGLIQYKGKPIETLLLDGDDLFGKSYSIGARNISSDLVETVEAIEDFHGNKLKKGLTKSDDVVLNLKFKKDKFKTSGEISAGFGIDNHLGNANIINLSNDIKGFGVLNINNISINQTSFQRNTYISENQDEIENSSIDFLNESNLNQNNIFPRSYINNLKFGTFSNLFKISNKINLKNSISLFNDTNNYSSFSSNEIFIDNNSIQTSNETFNKAKPIFISISNDLNVDLSKTSTFKFSNRLVTYDDIQNQTNLQNGVSIYKTEIKQSKLYYQQNFTYTKKTSNNDLIEFTLLNSNDSRKQSITFANQQNIIINDEVFNNMKYSNNREIFIGKLAYLKKIKKWNFEVIARQVFDKENFTINSTTNIYASKFKNIISNLTTNTNFEINKKIRLSGKLDVGYSKRELVELFEDNLINEKDLFINSELKTKFKLNNNSVFTMNFENENKIVDNYYLLSNPILIDSRTLINSNTTLDFQKKWKSFMNFSHFNLLKQSSFTFLTSYEEIQNSIVAEQNISEDVNIITYFQTPQTRKEINLSTSKTFFIDVINNKISINNNANFSRYFNALNGNNLNIVWSSIYNANIELNSAFKGFFNYKSSFGLTYIENKQKNSNTFINKTINAKLETILKISKKTYCKIENEILLPNGIDFNSNQLFIDFSLNSRGEKIEYFILSRNILNNNTFNQVYVSEFSKSIFSNNLFSRYVVFGLNYNF